MNNGVTRSEKGIENRHTDDCIEMYKPSPDQHTYIWTSCDDALWIDQMHLFAGDCSVGRRHLEERRSLWVGSIIKGLFKIGLTVGQLSTKYMASTKSNHCQAYGADNQAGWCLSQDRNDAKGDWEKYVPAKSCFKMFKLGKPRQNDGRVWGFQWTFRRRQLIESGVQAVKDCEAQNAGTGICEQLASQVMSHMLEDADASQQSWTDLVSEQDLKEDFDAFDKDGSGEIDFEEFKSVMKQYIDGPLSEEQTKRFTLLFQSADVNSNGSLSLEEFGLLVGMTDEDLASTGATGASSGTGRRV